MFIFMSDRINKVKRRKKKLNTTATSFYPVFTLISESRQKPGNLLSTARDLIKTNVALLFSIRLSKPSLFEIWKKKKNTSNSFKGNKRQGGYWKTRSGTHGRCSFLRSSRCECSHTRSCSRHISHTHPCAGRAGSSRGWLWKGGGRQLWETQSSSKHCCEKTTCAAAIISEHFQFCLPVALADRTEARHLTSVHPALQESDKRDSATTTSNYRLIYQDVIQFDKVYNNKLLLVRNCNHPAS